MKNRGLIFDIKKYSLHDGPGIRTTVFLCGCPLTCWWCQNPEGQKLNLEEALQMRRKSKSSLTTTKELIGREANVEEIVAEIERDRVFYEESGGGVTFSGGEPLLQHVFLNGLLDACLKLKISTALETCGYAPWEVVRKVKNKIDLFLYDLKLMDDKEHQKYTGASNVQILSNLTRLDSEGKNIVIRFPVIPEITDTEGNIRQIAEYISSLKTVREIDLLPYNKLGKGKYEKLNRLNLLTDLEPPSPERLNQLSERFKVLGLKVKIGG
nr:glycyl-radical enzyme activating protein [Candidatus Njordarchaeum guaymaensis]